MIELVLETAFWAFYLYLILYWVLNPRSRVKEIERELKLNIASLEAGVNICGSAQHLLNSFPPATLANNQAAKDLAIALAGQNPHV